MQQEFYSNGKLLLSGEYAILDGALGLALPTKFGQSLQIAPNHSGILEWKSLNHQNKAWFTVRYNIENFENVNSSDHEVSKTLSKLLIEARTLNPVFLKASKGCSVTTKLSFPRNWGLGSSSTLINNVAQWANVDAHQLLWKTMGGSGYDISCAQHDQPILYRLKKGLPEVEKVNFNPSFKEHLYFIHLNKKQDTRVAIANYKKQDFDTKKIIASLSEITKELLNSKDLKKFEKAIASHERMLSEVLKMKPIKELHFSDYTGAVKSLGGWGGDFILATGNERTPDYFKDKGFETVFRYADMVL